MNFLHTDLGSRKRGEIVVVTLQGDSMNVRLLDSSNLGSTREASSIGITEAT